MPACCGQVQPKNGQSDFFFSYSGGGFFFFLLFAVCTPHAEYYILFWRGVRGCLNNFSLWSVGCISLVSLPIVPNYGGDLQWFVVVCDGLSFSHTRQ